MTQSLQFLALSRLASPGRSKELGLHFAGKSATWSKRDQEIANLAKAGPGFAKLGDDATRPLCSNRRVRASIGAICSRMGKPSCPAARLLIHANSGGKFRRSRACEGRR